MSTEQQAPVWARPGAFPEKPVTGAFGFQDTKGKRHQADSLKSLVKLVEKSKHGVDLVWCPEFEHFIAPEELVGLRKTLVKRRSFWARNDISDGKRLTLVMGAAFLWASYAAYSNSQGNWSHVIESPAVAITAIMLLIFGLVPWYEGWKELRKQSSRDEAYWAKEVADARFDSWINGHVAPFTLTLLVLILVTGASQWIAAGSFDWGSEAVEKFGLQKQMSAAGVDPWWRYFTAAMVHGNLVHWLMNFAALRYLARRAEVLARWPHMVTAYVIAAFVGGMTTVYFQPNVPSVGASGGILGLLGFLLVFETLHKALVPKSARKRLLAGLVLVGVMGGVGFSFIDNSAHAGGLIAGMAYAAIVFPSSSSVTRPSILKKDIFVGGGALVILIATTVYCAYRLLLE
ncbi:rhomboid family intramembrane serine protease [Rubritalea spongiae]|uniref:Rhomboid family intramembrane serine protease n=1 Tax=Rubritalea spongiae TaxID=430797 RepID=A0ABW5E0C3_9BACT